MTGTMSHFFDCRAFRPALLRGGEIKKKKRKEGEEVMAANDIFCF